MSFRLIPTRAKPEGGFFESWFLHGTEAEAIVSAKAFFADWDVPVLVMRASEGGVYSGAVGVFGAHRLRATTVRR